MDPNTQAATLSGWPSPRRSFLQDTSAIEAEPQQPHSPLPTPATRAAALDPNPLAKGISFSMAISTGGMTSPAALATSSAVCQIKLSAPTGI